MRSTSLHVAFVVVFFVMGLPYWRIPYSSASLPNSLWGPAMLVVLAAPVAVLVLSNNTFARTSGVIGLAVPAMVMARVVVEAFQNPTTHNLWPFELVIASALGLAVASVGSLAGLVIARLLKVGAGRIDV
jgi:membrane-associated protease RseP (regulator of RpoE activity)